MKYSKLYNSESFDLVLVAKFIIFFLYCLTLYVISSHFIQTELVANGGHWENYKWYDSYETRNVGYTSFFIASLFIAISLFLIRQITKRFYFTFIGEIVFLLSIVSYFDFNSISFYVIFIFLLLSLYMDIGTLKDGVKEYNELMTKWQSQMKDKILRHPDGYINDKLIDVLYFKPLTIIEFFKTDLVIDFIEDKLERRLRDDYNIKSIGLMHYDAE